jgi:GTP-binding protein
MAGARVSGCGHRGIVPDDKEFIPSEIFRQARVAFDEAAAIVMVVARTEIAAPDRELARLLLRTGKHFSCG